MQIHRPLRFAADLERFCKSLQPESVVVDVCGGPYADEFLGLGYKVVSFEAGPHAGPDLAAPDKKTIFHSPVEDTLIPHRTVAGVWAGESLQYLDIPHARRRLSLFADWLLPEGVCSFVLREGEGKKKISDHGLASRTDRMLYLYQPADVEELVVSAGLQTLDAWRDGTPERAYIHVIAQRPLV